MKQSTQISKNLSIAERFSELEKLMKRAARIKSKELDTLLTEAHELASHAGDPKLQAICNYFETYKYVYVYPDYGRGLTIALESLEDYHPVLSNKYLGKFSNLAAFSYQMLGDFFKAREFFVKAVNYLEDSFGDDADSLSVQGNIYLNFQNFLINYQEDKQTSYLDKAIEIFRHLNDYTGISGCYNTYARICYLDHRIDDALGYLHKAVETIESDPTPNRGPYDLLSNIGLMYAKKGDLEKSNANFERVEAVYRLKPDAKLEGILHMQRGVAFRDFKLHDDAERHFKRALEHFESLNFRKGQDDVYLALSELYGEIGQLEKAHIFLKKHIEITKDLYKKEKELMVSKNLFEFEMRQKSKQIETLENLNRELNQFAYIASHDLKEPVRMIRMFTDLLEKDASGLLRQQDLELLGQIKMSSTKMFSLINDLLDYTRIGPQMELKEIDLNLILADVQNNLSALTDGKKLELKLDPMPRIMAVGSYMVQLFQNLLSNAVKHNVQEDIKVKITYHEGPAHLHFCVCDNGIGIPEEYRIRVFQLFQRLDRTDTSGTGIGLSVCRKIIDLMQGSIWVESNALGGSDFHIVLPSEYLIK